MKNPQLRFESHGHGKLFQALSFFEGEKKFVNSSLGRREIEGFFKRDHVRFQRARNLTTLETPRAVEQLFGHL